MRRILSVAFLSASLSIVPSALAQRTGQPGRSAGGFGGGAHIGGSAGRFSGGFAGGSGAPRFVAPGPVYGPQAPNFVSTAPTHAVSTAPSHAFGPAYRVPYAGSYPAWRRDGSGDRDRDRGRDFHYRSPYRGYGAYPYAYGNSWKLLPWDLGSSDSIDEGDNTAPDSQQQPASAAIPDDSYRPDYQAAEPPYPYPPAPPPDQRAASPVAPEPGLTLIFTDGHQETIHNYVLTASDVIVLDDASSGRQKRIPLASLDLTATRQAAQEAGLDFTPPA